VLSGPSSGLALRTNGDKRPHTADVSLPGSGPLTIELYDGSARPRGKSTGRGPKTEVTVPAHGFAIIRRQAGGA
jgi:hypothetical protein